jgi:DNA-binding beta-propeller fold protein YncE
MKQIKANAVCNLMVSIVLTTTWMLVLDGCNTKKAESTPKKYSNGVFIVNEGNFQFGNASVSFYDPATQKIENNIFETTNGFKLGDVAQSMNTATTPDYIVLNNSQKVMAIDATNDFKFLYSIQIDGSSPRHIEQINDSTAYVTELYANKIWVIDTKQKKVRKSIPVDGWTEQIFSFPQGAVAVQHPKPGTTTGSGLLFLETTTDILFETLPLSSEPSGAVKDKNGNVWVLCVGDSAKNIAPVLLYLSATGSVEKIMPFALSSHPKSLRYSKSDEYLYFIDNNALYRMKVTDSNLPTTSFLSLSGRNIYGVDADPTNGDLYLSDAIDYVQSSKIYRYSKDGNLIHSFNAGIISNGFVFSYE